MTDRIPLKFEYDDTTPSSLAEYTTSDTVPIANGGTAVSSLTLLGESLSAVPVLGASLSGATVSATTAYGLSVSTCPVPVPFGYIQLTADDGLSVDEKRVGYSNTPTSMVSDSSHITWNDGVKQFDVSAAGIYEVVSRLTFEGGASLVTIKIQKSGSAMNTSTPRVHSTVDPVERTMSAIFACASGDCIFVTYDATSSNTVKTIIGTTVTVKRIQ